MFCFFFHLELKQAVLSRQREFKLAALHAKQSGNIEQAKEHYLIAKVTEPGCLLTSTSVFMYMLLRVTPNRCDIVPCRTWTRWWKH